MGLSMLSEAHPPFKIPRYMIKEDERTLPLLMQVILLDLSHSGFGFPQFNQMKFCFLQ